jgi:predicted acetyltransferase
MIIRTDNIDWVKPLFKQYMWHMKQYYEINDVSRWIEQANMYYDLYRTDRDRLVYVTVINNELSGFALVNSVCSFNQTGRSIAEFYIQPEKHNHGYGRELAEYVFEQHPGQWEIRVTSRNKGAFTFWSKIVEHYMGINFSVQSKESYDGQAFLFNNS